MSKYCIINLEEVTIEKEHPYTLVFKGYIPTFDGRKLYTFKYDGDIAFTDAPLHNDIKKDFAKQLCEDYRCGIMFDLSEVREKLETKYEYRMEM